jgi:hypothetical protein
VRLKEKIVVKGILQVIEPECMHPHVIHTVFCLKVRTDDIPSHTCRETYQTDMYKSNVK